MAGYCIAPKKAGICGKKLPCKFHLDQDYDEPENNVCLHVRNGIGAPGVCGVSDCTKHIAKETKKSSVQRSTKDLKRKIVVKVPSSIKKRRVLSADDKSYSNSIKESSESSSSSSSSSSSKKYSKLSKKHKKEKKHKHSPKESVPLELAPPMHDVLDTYALIEKERQKLLKLELRNSKKITKLIAAKNNISDSSVSSDSDL
jgi:hypothetical protein